MVIELGIFQFCCFVKCGILLFLEVLLFSQNWTREPRQESLQKRYRTLDFDSFDTDFSDFTDFDRF